MNIGLDFDDTYTRDPEGWDAFIQLMRGRGHKVYCVTWRSNTTANLTEVGAALNGKVDAIFFTGQQAKKDYMYSIGIRIDVWIDDMPFAVEDHGQVYLNMIKNLPDEGNGVLVNP